MAGVDCRPRSAVACPWSSGRAPIPLPSSSGRRLLWLAGGRGPHDVHMSERPRGPAVVFAGTVALVAAAWTMWFAGGLTFADAGDAYLINNTVMTLTFTA